MNRNRHHGMNRILALLTALMMLLAAVPAAFAEQDPAVPLLQVSWQDAEGNVQAWVMDSMNYYWDMVTFENLILNSEGKYDVSYKRNYSLDAELHVFDIANTWSKTISKEIVIN